MIATFGGTITDQFGNRITPGSGGQVGSNDITGVGYAWIAGVGKEYFSFNPDGSRNLIPGPDYPQNPLPVPGDYPTNYPTNYPPVEQIPSDIPQIPSGNLPSGNSPNSPVNTPPIIVPPETNSDKTILETVKNLFSGMTPKGLTSPPLYIYNPPGPSGQQSFNYNVLIVIAVLGIGSYFILKHFNKI